MVASLLLRAPLLIIKVNKQLITRLSRKVRNHSGGTFNCLILPNLNVTHVNVSNAMIKLVNNNEGMKLK